MATHLVSSDIGSSQTFPGNSAETSAVREQMERLLASPHLSNSKRYPVFLRYVIEETLDGRADELKERTIGIEVFQRDPNYDTNLDPVVRVTASEVRRRIAYYYQDSNNRDEVRVDLPPGSYIPQFRLCKRAAPADADALASLSTLVASSSPTASAAAPSLPASSLPAPSLPAELPQPVASTSGESAQPLRQLRWIGWVAAIAVLATSGLVAARVLLRKQPALESMWAPLLSANTPLLISVGQHSATDLAQVAPPKPVSVREHAGVSFVVLSDVQALVRVDSMLAGMKQPVRIQSANVTTYGDLRQQPAILMGGYNNPWTMRALSPLRFSFGRDPLNHVWFIQDHRSPDAKTWSVDTGQDYASLTRDYGVVARFKDPTTNQVEFVIAGIGEDGTKAASEFATDPASIQALFSGSTGNSNSLNFEAVIGTQVVNGVSGPPQLLAKEIW